MLTSIILLLCYLHNPDPFYKLEAWSDFFVQHIYNKDKLSHRISQGEKGFIRSQGGDPGYGELVPSSVSLLARYLAIQSQDVFYDLGSGLGKLVMQIYLETPTRKAVGIELSESRYRAAEQAKKRLQSYMDLPKDREYAYIHANILDVNLSDATIIFMCSTLYPEELLRALVKKFDRELAKNVRIISLKSLPTNISTRLKKIDYFYLPTTWSQGSPMNIYQMDATS